jgi:hypothetical protein
MQDQDELAQPHIGLAQKHPLRQRDKSEKHFKNIDQWMMKLLA